MNERKLGRPLATSFTSPRMLDMDGYMNEYRIDFHSIPLAGRRAALVGSQYFLL